MVATDNVLITGASSGIGRATALRLAQRGARLTLVARGRTALDQAAQECWDAGARAVVVVVADVGDRTEVAAAFATAIDEFGHLDAVVHAAAVVAYGRFEDVPPEVFDQVVTTDVLGTANVARAALAHFQPRGRGTLVLMGSLLGRITAPFIGTYAVTKWTVRALARTLHEENLGRPDVHVCEVWPCGVNTPAYQQAANYAGRVGRPPPPVVPAARVAATILAVLDRPRPRAMVGLANPVVIGGFTLLPWAFDRLVVPLMARLGLGREPMQDDPGSVHEPRPDLNATDGPWRGPLGWRR